jgi:7-cyano-7-deazaguanine synthase
LSGGLDSATCLAFARREGFECHTLSFDYGQRHRVELDRAHALAKALGAASHRVVAIDLRTFGHSALTDDIAVPKHREASEMSAGIPVTYVPARNTIFLALAMAHAEVVEADAIFTGANAIDYSGYPDCRPEYLQAFQRMANLATKRAVEGHPISIEAPLVRMTKAQIVRHGHELGVDFALTVSCYDADAEGRACARCDSCRLRREGFAAAGIADPTRYQG